MEKFPEIKFRTKSFLFFNVQTKTYAKLNRKQLLAWFSDIISEVNLSINEMFLIKISILWTSWRKHHLRVRFTFQFSMKVFDYFFIVELFNVQENGKFELPCCIKYEYLLFQQLVRGRCKASETSSFWAFVWFRKRSRIHWNWLMFDMR